MLLFFFDGQTILYKRPALLDSDAREMRLEIMKNFICSIALKNNNPYRCYVILSDYDKHFKFSLWLDVIVPLNFLYEKDKFIICGLRDPSLSLWISNDKNTDNSFKSAYNKIK